MPTVNDYVFELPLRTEAELNLFVQKAFGVKIPDVVVCEGHTSPWRAFCDAYFARSPITIWKGSRGFAGKSYTLAALGMTEAATLKVDVNILGGSGEQSKRVHDYQNKFWDFNELLKHNLLTSDPFKMETRLAWGNSIKALLASQASIRGPHPARLRIDEADEVALPIMDAALGQAMSQDGVPAQTVISSTHQYPNGTMTELLKRAADKGHPVMQWCWRECLQPHGWLTQAEVDTKKLTVTQKMWDVEYELQEPSPEGRAINSDAVQRMFNRDLGEYDGNAREYIELEPPVTDGKYAHGADWARKQDWTVILTFRIDTKPYRLVAFERTGREPWPVMIEKLDARVRRYGGAGLHDGTGIGDVVEGYLKSNSIKPIMMVGRDRANLLSEYIAAIERGEIEAPFIRFMEQEHRYATVDDVYGGGHLPDSIAAGALTYKAATTPTGIYFG